MGGGSVKRPISFQSPIDVDQTAILRTQHGERPACCAGRRSNSIGMNRAVDEERRKSGGGVCEGGVRRSGGRGGGLADRRQLGGPRTERIQL